MKSPRQYVTRIYFINIINLEQFYFLGEPGVHREFIYKLRRCGFGVRYYLNGTNKFYSITDGSIYAFEIDDPLIARILENKTRVNFEEYKAIVDTYIQERIINGDWWFELNIGDKIQILDEFPDGMFALGGHKEVCGKILRITNISPFYVEKGSALVKSEYFNGDYTGYYLEGTSFRTWFSWMFLPKNTTPIEKISLSSIVLPKIIL